MSESDHDNEVKQDPPAQTYQKKRSLVWHFFERINHFRIRCYLCQHQQNYQGTTGNILRHMKSKHDVDLTLKGQQDPENQKRIKELCEAAASASGRNIKTEQYQSVTFSKPSRKRKNPQLDNGYDLNSNEDNNEEGAVEGELHPLETYVTSEVPYYLKEDSMEMPNEENIMASSTKKTTSQLEDERLKAETKYFHEKAGYYKLLKHLTALQAKKVKIEIELLTSNADNNKII